MSRRKENIRKSLDRIDRCLEIMEREYSIPKDAASISIAREELHRIKRTTWRNDENKLDNKITDEIIDIAMRSFKK